MAPELLRQGLDAMSVGPRKIGISRLTAYGKIKPEK
jgi:hypothetical protein